MGGLLATPDLEEVVLHPEGGYVWLYGHERYSCDGADGKDFLYYFVGYGSGAVFLIDLYYPHRTVGPTAQRECCDVDGMTAENQADLANHAGLIFVIDDDKGPL